MCNGAMSEWMYKNDFDHKAKMGHGAYLDTAIRGERCDLHGGMKCLCRMWHYNGEEIWIDYQLL
jgi:hypothetical protein